MTGGLINIVSYGVDDLFLTGSPQITFFKLLYRRYTNFSRESISVPIGDINFNDEITIQFPKVGDLISNTYLQMVIPKMNLLRTDTATNLTSDELATLQGPRPSSFTSEQIAIVNDYNDGTINNFMAINIAGYRVAVNNLNIQNQTSTEYGNAILTVLVFPHNENISYGDALNRAYSYEYSVQNYGAVFYLTNLTSDISLILNNINDTVGFSSLTVQDIYRYVVSAFNASQDVKNYYYNNVLNYNNTNTANASLYAKFAWIQRLGHAMIDCVDITIGGQRVDRHYGDFMNVWRELTTTESQQSVYDRLIGNVSSMTTFDSNAKPQYTVNIPLNFWFCARLGLAFPMIALQYNQIELTLKLNPIERCAYIETLPTKDLDGNPISITGLSLSDIWDNLALKITTNLLVDYIYLDKLERRRFAQSSHEYLIETLQNMTFTQMSNSLQNIILEFDGPCKELIWVMQKDAYNNGDSYHNKLIFNYSLNGNGVGNPLVNSSLTLHGYKIFGNNTGSVFVNAFFNYLQPYEHHTRTPADGINVYSFGLYPEEHQPSGTCNFTVLTNSQLNLSINTNMFSYKLSDTDPNIVKGSDQDLTKSTTISIYVYATRYDILRVIGGFAGLATQYLVKS